MNKIKVIAGLGNPGKEYERTYHNAGELFVSWLAEEFGTSFTKGINKNFEYAKVPRLAGIPLTNGDKEKFTKEKINFLRLVRPLTFMNVSGNAVLAAIKTFKTIPKELLLAHDDSDIPLGNYKIVFGRGAAGHHGAESVIRTLGVKNFWRARIGVRARKYGKKKAEDFVMRFIPDEELKILYGVFGQIKEKLTANENPSGSDFIFVKGKTTLRNEASASNAFRKLKI